MKTKDRLKQKKKERRKRRVHKRLKAALHRKQEIKDELKKHGIKTLTESDVQTMIDKEKSNNG